MGPYHHLLRDLQRIDPLKNYSVFLYGSHLYGTNHPTSDIDILILSENEISPTEKKRLLTKFEHSFFTPFLMSKRSFDINRNHSFYFASHLEEIARSHQRFSGEIEITPLLTDEAFLHATWLLRMLELSQLKFVNTYDKIVSLSRVALFILQLEKKWPIGSTSLGAMAHTLMGSDLGFPKDDILSRNLEESMVLWRWIEPTMPAMSDDTLKEWEHVAFDRLKAFSAILQRIALGPLTREGLERVRGIPLYAHIPWQMKDNLYVMQDDGKQFLVNFAKIAFRRYS
jgi:predicted nucleotidyltransferase